MPRLPISQPLAFFAITALAIAVAWWWLGKPVALPPSPLPAGEKLYCVSYAPFRDGQDPLIETTQIPPQQIDEDLKFLAQLHRLHPHLFGRERPR